MEKKRRVHRERKGIRNVVERREKIMQGVERRRKGPSDLGWT